MFEFLLHIQLINNNNKKHADFNKNWSLAGDATEILPETNIKPFLWDTPTTQTTCVSNEKNEPV